MSLAARLTCLATGGTWLLPQGSATEASAFLDGETVLASREADSSDLVDVAVSLLEEAACERWPDGIGAAYKTGWCGELAIALAQLSGGVIVAVIGPLDEDWNEIPGEPHLVHADVLSVER